MKFYALIFQIGQLCVLCCASLWAQPVESPKLPASLPVGLTDAEVQLIRKETNPKDHVEAVTRVAEARLAQAFKQAADNPEAALKDLELYSALMTYGNDHTRYLNLPVKERNKILKVIEQSIFKQQRNLEGTRQQLPIEAREQTEKLVEAIKRIRLRAIDDVLGNGGIIK
ncbi:MAG: hypothetical protein HOP19_05820 [Acidobacteria bacterium]|nr:hypothetical protein [Acidobacteriota bacterium]